MKSVAVEIITELFEAISDEMDIYKDIIRKCDEISIYLNNENSITLRFSIHDVFTEIPPEEYHNQ